ncbi:MAG: ATP-dependent DNA helicase UvrD2 [Acidimicrobiales bacterium]
MPDPISLGRSVVVGPNDVAPGEWSSCERVRVTAVNRELADLLGAAWRQRHSVVIELTPGIGLDDPEMPPAEAITGRQPWEWSADLDLLGERLHHGVWANSLDARGGSSGRRWRWAELACSLGATLSESEGDILMRNGAAAVCDGGPLDAGLSGRVDLPVVHRVLLEQGILRPLGVSDPTGVELARDQFAAVTEPGAMVRVIAPAGSGKTRVLTERARLLLQGWGLPPGAVALVAYNARAAKEMRTRLEDVAEVQVRTLNALGLRLCANRSTIEEVEVRRLLGALVKFPIRAETDPLAPWIKALGRVRLGLVDPATVEGELPDVSDLERVARAYRGQLFERGVVDFDEQVTCAIEALLGDPAFRLRVQRSARVLLVDEFQDLTPAHLLLIRLLSGPAGAVFAVGDDDQTIYGYAGATPRWLVDFGHWFPGAALHSLEVNYRCPPPVVTAASNLLTRNRLRVPKVIRPAPRDQDPASDSACLSILTGEDGPAARAARRVRELLDAGAMPSEVAVLARVNASLAPVQVLLANEAVPVNGGVSRYFLQRGGVRAALDWLGVATAPQWALAGSGLREAARRPKRAMSRSLLELVGRQRSMDGLVSLADWLEAKASDREADKVRDFAGDLKRVRDAAEGGTTADILAVLRSQVGSGGLDASATALDRWSHGAIAAHADDLDALAELADLESDASRFPAWLAEQLGAPGDPDGITLASIHAVKGREWPHVVVHHATAGLLPHRLAEDLEEERRVFHVALTRCSISTSIIAGPSPSPFLLELAQPVRPSAHAESQDQATRVPDSRPAPLRRETSARIEMLIGAAGSRFSHRGRDCEIVELAPDGARVLLGGGPATTLVAFGTSVTVDGTPLMLAHSRSADAWETLRSWRAKRARAAGRPAFVVFDDKTLRLVAAVLPTTEAGLLEISGIGPVKLESYGDELISIAERLRMG